TNQKFWAEWNAFEIETGSEDTFREYLRIKRAVQAAFNTEASYLSAKLAQMQAAQPNSTASTTEDGEAGAGAADPMAALEGAGTMRGFVAATGTKTLGGQAGGAEEPAAPAQANADEIQMSDDEEEDEE
ncbi:hypothetical protein JCM10213_003203, partial [Rhodosporidiobolus nylandii]